VSGGSSGVMRTLIEKYIALWVKSERAKLLAPTEEEKRAIEDRKRPTSRPPTSRTGAWRTPKPLSPSGVTSVSGVYRVMHADPETTYRFVRVSGTFWGVII